MRHYSHHRRIKRLIPVGKIEVCSIQLLIERSVKFGFQKDAVKGPFGRRVADLDDLGWIVEE